LNGPFNRALGEADGAAVRALRDNVGTYSHLRPGNASLDPPREAERAARLGCHAVLPHPDGVDDVEKDALLACFRPGLQSRWPLIT
jgi:hypothetical protein